jgi:hypothetical protein
MTLGSDLGGGERGANGAVVSPTLRLAMVSGKGFTEASSITDERRKIFEWTADCSVLSQHDIEQDRTLAAC